IPAWVRETVGWLRTRSLPVSRPIVSPSVSRTTGYVSRSLRVMMNLLVAISNDLSHRKIDHLNNMYQHQRKHQRGREHVWGDPQLERLVQVDERVHTTTDGRQLDDLKETVPVRLGQSVRHLLELKSRAFFHRLEIFTLEVLAHQVAERKEPWEYAPLYQHTGLPSPAGARRADLVSQFRAAGREIIEQQRLTFDFRQQARREKITQGAE